MSVKIGIPRALLYYEYSSLWISFFKNLGADVIISDHTNKKILNQGTNYTVDDACIPVKIYHGHVLNLKDKADYLFIPRIMGVEKGDYICPKFCGLPEMVKYSINDIPNIINTTIDLTKSNKHFNETILEIGSYVSPFKNRILACYEHALEKYNLNKERLKKGLLPMDREKEASVDLFNSTKQKIMIMGHPYLLYDDYLNMNIMKKLRKQDFTVITPEMIDEDKVKEYANKFHGKLFWTFSRKLIGTCFYLIDHKNIDGVIYISSFGCGIDSVVVEAIERRLRKSNDIPFLLITLDEHSGEAGFNTRLEAFVDMLKWRNRNESNLSTHG